MLFTAIDGRSNAACSRDPAVIASGKAVVLERAGPLGADVLIQAAAERHIQHLQAATQSEQRFPVFHRPPRELQLDEIARRIDDAAFGALGLAEIHRIDIHTASQQHAVQPIVDLVQGFEIVGEERDHPRHAADSRRRVKVALAHHPRRRQFF
jgi:hypothetical protein